MINTTCPAKDCVERLENYPPFCHLHWKIVPFAMAADINLNYESEKVRQGKHFRRIMEQAVKWVDKIVDELLAIRERQPKG